MKELKEYFNNKKTLTLSIIAIVALIAIVSGATFAYFATTKDLNGSTPVNTQTASSMYSFSAIANETIEFNISASEMSEANASTNVLKSDSANIYVELSSASDSETTTCTYDVQWVWDSADKYTESDVELPYTKDGKTYPYELSITVDGKNETDLSALTWTDNKAIVASGLEIVSTSKAPVKLTHLIEVKSYNIPVHQANLYNKNFKAHLEVVNNSCKASNEGKAEEINQVLASYISEKSGETISQEDNGETYTGAIVDENGIRYEGKNPNNYVVFNYELWRIIGVFDEETHGRSGEQLVKLIRAEALPEYYQWNRDYNNWNNATLNTTLNTSYYNNSTINACSNYNSSSCTATIVENEGIKSDVARNMIQGVQWKIGGHKSNSSPASAFYVAERGTVLPTSSGATAVTTEELPIGLMYPSDYGFAVQASDCSRTESFYYYKSTAKCYTENWLWDSSANQWTITPDSWGSRSVWSVYSTGGVDSKNSYYSSVVAPVLYLKADVRITGGQGTKNNPYIIGLENNIIPLGKDYVSDYDGKKHGISLKVYKPASGYKIYYSTTTELTKDNYKTDGTTTNPTMLSVGTTKVYWCAEANGYETICSNNKIVINPLKMNVTGTNYSGDFDNDSHSADITVKEPTNDYQIYYSTSTKLTKDNYATGSTDVPTRTEAGTTPVYWCVVDNKGIYETTCGKNSIVVNALTMSASGTDYVGDYDGNGHSISVSVTIPTSGYQIYYSTTTYLYESNYENGSTTNPIISEASETTVYWCAVADNYNPYCSSNIVSLLTGEKALLNVGNASTSITNALNNTSSFKDSDDTTYFGAIVNENGKRYEGKNPNNYVSFNDELWRIIGVFDENTHGRSGEQLVKLIKAESIGNYAWDSSGNENWNNASLKILLNNSYYNNDGISGIKSDTVRNMIQPIYWKIGGHNTDRITASVMYEKERGTTVPSGATAVTTEELPIGLMYPSDYGYAVQASDCARTTKLYYYDETTCHTHNWLFKKDSYWTISPGSSSRSYAWVVSAFGHVYYDIYKNYDSNIVPVLYLKQNVQITGGSGTKIDPYTLSYTE